MPVLYLLALLIALTGMVMLDRRFRLFFWRDGRRAAITLIIGVLFFLAWDIAGVGLGIDFAKTMRESDANVAIGLIPCAVGGTRLDQWSRGGKLYDAALARARAGQQAGELKGVLWHQGESDSTDKLAPTYGVRLARFINDLRRDLNNPELPFVVGELGYFRRDAHPPTDAINRQLHALGASDRRIAIATAQGLSDNGDKTHFDAESLRRFGRRYGESMLRAIEEASPSPKED